MTSLADEELLPPDATPGLTRLLSPAQELAGLARAAAEAAAKLARRARARASCWCGCRPAWIAPGRRRRAPARLDAPARRARRASSAAARSPSPSASLAAQPGARASASTLHDVRNVREAEHAFDALARDVRASAATRAS